MFDDFWKAYPNKKAKIAARKAYDKALKLTTHEAIMAGVANYVAAEPWNGDKSKCKHPATWLNAGCWDDEHEAPARELDWWERMDNSKRIRAEVRRDKGYDA